MYFACLGLGFITVGLALLQNLTLLLGHPIFTLSILLFTLLASGGLGSWASGRFRLAPVCLATALVATLYALALPRVVPALLPLPLLFMAGKMLDVIGRTPLVVDVLPGALSIAVL